MKGQQTGTPMADRIRRPRTSCSQSADRGAGERSARHDMGARLPQLLDRLHACWSADARVARDAASVHGRRCWQARLWAASGRVLVGGPACGIDLPREEPVSAPAFCKARRKLKPELLARLLTKVCGALAERHEGRCNGTAVESSRWTACGITCNAALISPSTSECRTEAIARRCGLDLFDVIGKLPCAATIAPGSSCERQEMLKLIAH